MSANDYLKFKGVAHIGDASLMNMLESNLKSWFDWCLLRIGGWSEVNISTVQAYGGDMSELRLVDDKQYTRGQVWESVRKDWVYEAGVDYTDRDGTTHNPQQVGVPQVNGSPYGGSYHINYPLGRVIFDSAISTSATVKLEYSYRDVQVYRADDVPWFTELQYSSFRADTERRNMPDLSKGSHIRRQMPCIIIETIPRGDSRPYELGSGALIRRQDVAFHVIAEDRNYRNNLLDYCAAQTDKEIWLYEQNRVAAAGAFPIDYRGMKINNNNYDDLVAENGYRWRECNFVNATIMETISSHPELFQGVVKTTCQVVFGQI